MNRSENKRSTGFSKVIPANGNMVLDDIDKTNMKRDIEAAVHDILHAMRFDHTDANLNETPERISRMFVDEIFRGCFEPAPKLTTFPVEGKGDMVFLGNIDLYSTCSHHFKSFAGKAHIAYLPNKKLVGISKLARITDWFARRPQLQEGLTAQIADYLMSVPKAVSKVEQRWQLPNVNNDDFDLLPLGCAVHIEAVHNCMKVRGVQQSNSVMQTTALRGCFLDDKTMVDEFYSNIERLK